MYAEPGLLDSPFYRGPGAANMIGLSLPIGPVLFDADSDGALDLAISTAYQGRVTDFYWGAGDGTFVLDSLHAGMREEYGGCMAATDLDNDGDIDLALGNYM